MLCAGSPVILYIFCLPVFLITDSQTSFVLVSYHVIAGPVIFPSKSVKTPASPTLATDICFISSGSFTACTISRIPSSIPVQSFSTSKSLLSFVIILGVTKEYFDISEKSCFAKRHILQLVVPTSIPIKYIFSPCLFILLSSLSL